LRDGGETLFPSVSRPWRRVKGVGQQNSLRGPSISL
jgi:hypothetical protein